MKYKIKLKILKEAREILLKRDRTFRWNGDDNTAACHEGLCDILYQLAIEHSLKSTRSKSIDITVEDYFPEFTQEYCDTISKINRIEGLWWWPVYRKELNNPSYSYYDVESRLKVINNLIELYSTKK